MSEFEEIIKNNEFVGIVEDNDDPDKKQRVRIRVPFIHGSSNDIPTSSLPWANPKRDLNGLSFSVPDKAKVVNVYYPDGNIYYPIYDSAEHLNINLQKKIEEYSGDDYKNFIALLYNHNCQIYVDNQKGLFLRYKFNEINVSEDGMAMNLKDNQATLYLGDEKGNQESILGTNFMQWFDTLMQTLMDAYIGNSGAPVIANPNLINTIAQYNAKRNTFLSKHVYLTDNNQIRRDKIEFDAQIGDEIEQTVKSTNIKIEKQSINYPKPVTEGRGIADQNDYTPPIDANRDKTSNSGIVTSDMDDEVNRLIRYLKSKGFKYYENKFVLNIVGIRNKIKDDGIISNRYDDWIYVFYVNADNKWVLLKYQVTTTPGFKPKDKILPLDQAALMAYGQYENQYRLGYHQNRTGRSGGKVDKTGKLYPEHRCLKFATTAFIRNDSGASKYSTQKTKPIQKASIGLNIHNSGNNSSGSVYNWSEGCQVFLSKKQHDEFISLCDQQVNKTGKGDFTYTLIPQRDYDNFEQ